MLVYLLRFPNGKCYIGATTQELEQRIRQHRSAANSGSDFPVHNAIRKYVNFDVEILSKANNLSELEKLEKEAIVEFRGKTQCYNVKSGGFQKTGAQGSSISQKRRAHFQHRNNRDKASTERGGSPFVVYSILKGEIVGEWISKGLCGQDLGIDKKGLANVLKGVSKHVNGYVACYTHSIKKLPHMIERAPKAFVVLDTLYGDETIWFNISQCSKALGISRSTINKMLTGRAHNVVSSSYRYKIYYNDIE